MTRLTDKQLQALIEVAEDAANGRKMTPNQSERAHIRFRVAWLPADALALATEVRESREAITAFQFKLKASAAIANNQHALLREVARASAALGREG